MPRFHDWFSHSSASFPYSHERRAAILQSRKSLDGELLFDKLLALLQIQGSIVYPPSSPVQLEQLFRLIAENEDVEPLKKFCLIYYLLRDSSDRESQQFADRFCIPKPFLLAVHGLWEFDNRNFAVQVLTKEAVELLVEPSVVLDWPEKILVALVNAGEFQLGYRFYKAQGPMTWAKENLPSILQVVKHTNFDYALDFVREHASWLGSDGFMSLFKTAFQGPETNTEKSQVAYVLTAKFSIEEESLLLEYCQKNLTDLTFDFILSYLVQHCKYGQAVQMYASLQRLLPVSHARVQLIENLKRILSPLQHQSIEIESSEFLPHENVEGIVMSRTVGIMKENHTDKHEENIILKAIVNHSSSASKQVVSQAASPEKLAPAVSRTTPSNIPTRDSSPVKRPEAARIPAADDVTMDTADELTTYSDVSVEIPETEQHALPIDQLVLPSATVSATSPKRSPQVQQVPETPGSTKGSPLKFTDYSPASPFLQPPITPKKKDQPEVVRFTSPRVDAPRAGPGINEVSHFSPASAARHASPIATSVSRRGASPRSIRDGFQEPQSSPLAQPDIRSSPSVPASPLAHKPPPSPAQHPTTPAPAPPRMDRSPYARSSSTETETDHAVSPLDQRKLPPLIQRSPFATTSKSRTRQEPRKLAAPPSNILQAFTGKSAPVRQRSSSRILKKIESSLRQSMVADDSEPEEPAAPRSARSKGRGKIPATDELLPERPSAKTPRSGRKTTKTKTFDEEIDESSGHSVKSVRKSVEYGPVSGDEQDETSETRRLRMTPARRKQLIETPAEHPTETPARRTVSRPKGTRQLEAPPRSLRKDMDLLRKDSASENSTPAGSEDDATDSRQIITRGMARRR